MIAYFKTKPYALRCDEEQRLQSLGALISVKATAEQTGGAFNLFDVFSLPDYETSLQIHYAEDIGQLIACKFKFQQEFDR